MLVGVYWKHQGNNKPNINIQIVTLIILCYQKLNKFILEETNTYLVLLSARSMKSACLITDMSEVSMELIQACFYGQLRLTKFQDTVHPSPAKPDIY